MWAGRVPDRDLGPRSRSLDFGVLVHDSMINIKSRSRQRLYLAKGCANREQAMQIGEASAAEIGPAIGVDRLSLDVARGGPAQEPDGGRDVLRLATLA
jgi:hypothetical protein